MSLNLVLTILKVLYSLVNFFEALRDKKAEATVETERGKAAALDDKQIDEEVNKWTKP